MKKYSFLLLLFVSLSVFSIKAQDSKFGLKAGINLASFNGDDSEIFKDTETGYLVGLVYDYIYTDRIGLQFDFMYTQTKTKNDFNNDSSSITIGYIDIPIVFKYYFNRNINLHLGPQFSLLSNATFGDVNDATGLFKIGKTSAVFGAEYKFEMGLVFNIRYALGLTSILADYEDYQGADLTTTSFDAKYNSTQISVAYLF